MLGGPMTVRKPVWSMTLIVFASILSASLSGCSSKPPFDLASVHGKVMIDGQPLTAGRVMFAPIAQSDSLHAGKPAFGDIGADGSYTLATDGNNDGAVVGKHWVTIYTQNAQSAIAAAAATQTKVGGNSPPTPKFSSIKFPRTPVEVVSGKDNQIDIPLTAKDIARFGVRE
jgi:hypothetical protein